MLGPIVPDRPPAAATDRPALRRADLAGDPLEEFRRWMAAAEAVVPMAEAVALATADSAGRPSVRMVLLKAWDPQGLLFHTNYDSRKGRELAGNPRAALVVHWAPLGRQVRAEGPVTPVSEAESDAYFATRPRGAQLGAHASAQSRPLSSRQELRAAVAEADRRFAGRPVPRPAGWGGLRLRPEVWEFWQLGPDRLHDRFRYQAGPAGWRLERLWP